MRQIRALVVDDHPLMREALRAALEAEPDMEVVGEAADGVQAVRQALALRPDVVVLDLQLPVQGGVAAIVAITAADPAISILAITSDAGEERAVAAVQAGAQGFLLKDATRDQLLDGVRQVAGGGLFLSPEVAAQLARGLRRALAAPPTRAEALTPREHEVLALLGEGLANQAIAARLGLSDATVRVHVHHMLGKLGLADRGGLVAYAVRQSGA